MKLYSINHLEKTSNFSLIHLNIRSVPLHFTEFISYLDTLDIDFKIIAFSETAINSSHIKYNIPNYNVEKNLEIRKRVVVSVYIFRINFNINYEMTYNSVGM